MSTKLRKSREVLGVGSQEIVSFALSCKNYIAILYKSWFLEIRESGECEEEKLGKVLHRFGGITCKDPLIYPKIKWNKRELYLVFKHNLEIFSLQKRQRKQYNDILTIQQLKTEEIIDMCCSRMIQQQRVVTLQLKRSLIFTLIPIPVTKLQIEGVSQMLHLSYQQTQKETTFPREYIVLVLNNRIIRFYNYINMKQIYQLDFSSRIKKGHRLRLSTDPSQEFILAQFSDSKCRVYRNQLLKVNGQYYCIPTFEYFAEEEQFINWECDLPVKDSISLMKAQMVYLQNQKRWAVNVTAIGLGDKQANLLVYQMNILLNEAKISKRGVKEWEELREWKDIITSYMELNHDVIYGSRAQQNQTKLHQQTVAEVKTEREQRRHNTLCLQSNNLMKKFTKTHDQRDIIFDNLNENEPQQKIEKEWTTYFQKYLIENNSHFNPSGLLKNSLQKIGDDLEEIQAQTKRERVKNIKEIKQERKKMQQTMRRERQERQQMQQKITNQKRASLQPIIQEYMKEYERAKNGHQGNIQDLLMKKYYEIEEEWEDQKKQKDKNHSLDKQYSQTQNTFKKRSMDLHRLVQISNHPIDNQSKIQYGCQTDQNQLQFFGQEENGSDYFREQPVFYQKIRHLEKAVTNGFKPLDQHFMKLEQTLVRIQEVHCYKLKKCQNILQTQRRKYQNLDNSIRGYFREMLSQVGEGIKQKLENFTQKVQASNQKVAEQRKETVRVFEKYLKEQIKHRSEIFQANRNDIENHLVKIRKKILSGEFKSTRESYNNGNNELEDSSFQSESQYIQRILNDDEDISSSLKRK